MKVLVAILAAANFIAVGMNFDRWIMYQSTGSLIVAGISLVVGVLLLEAYGHHDRAL